ncbi:MAG TPA: ABC transporter permease, partial [Nevskiaceae bacterium]|nr:ABC transporter permease [Nevskiaceae bacterium]
MKFLPLVWSMLWHRRARTLLTASSIAAAFLLYGMLQAVGAVLTLGPKASSANALITSHRYGMGKSLPYAYRAQIEAVPGVTFAGPTVFVPFIYQEASTGTQPSLGLDPEFFAHDARFVVDAATLQAFKNKRSALIVGRELAQKYGWKTGDHVPLKSPYIKRRDGAPYWEFDVVGEFHYNADLLGEGISAMRTFARYDYLDEGRRDPGGVNMYMVRVADPAQATDVARQIDALFQNSANPTKTQTEAEQQRSMLAQIGDVGIIIRAILSAVFFTLVVVAGNTMMRSFRER